MIVFTATNLKTQDVYVGTAKESVEEEWADLLSQADNGSSGQFFEQLRDHGSAAFEVDTWAYGENAAEARESMREAREDLGAQPIKSNRGQSAGRSTQAVQSASMKALMAVFEEALSNDGPLDEDDMLDGLSPKSARDDDSETVAESEDDLDDDDDLKPAAKAAMPTVDKPAAEVTAKKPVAKKAAAKAETAATSPADDEQKMLSRLDAMRAAQEKLLRQRDEPAGSSNSGVIGASGTGRSAPIKAPKIATGRTGSADKERRIREAIETDRDRRDNLRHTSSREEQTEMNVVMARIELRRLATKKANAEKAKVQAAERRAKAKAEAINIAEALAKEMAANVVQTEVSSEAIKPSPAKPVLAAKAATKSLATKSLATTPAAAKASQSQAGAPLKLAAGRTGSGQKEKRIREAIELEKAERQAQQQSRRAVEAREMAEIMAKLEERTKEAEKLKRRR